MEEVLDSMRIAKENMDKAVEHLNHELLKLRTGKASTDLVAELLVEYYGSPTMLSSVANITTPDARTIAIQPWEKKMIGPIEKSILMANLGMTPQNDGEVIRLTVPPLTEERRKDLVKKAKAICEDTKVGIRNARHKVLDQIKRSQKDGLPEDMAKKKENEAQARVNEYIEKVDKIFTTKEKEILTV